MCLANLEINKIRWCDKSLIQFIRRSVIVIAKSLDIDVFIGLVHYCSNISNTYGCGIKVILYLSKTHTLAEVY